MWDYSALSTCSNPNQDKFIVKTFMNAFSNAIAICISTYYVNDPTGHSIEIEITMNRYYVNLITPLVLAHEFGHAFGLGDLYDDSNKNKLMYGYAGSATGITSIDFLGAYVIAGVDKTHMAGSIAKYHYKSMSKHTTHNCITCNGHLLDTLTSCLYVNNKCKFCKHIAPTGEIV